MTSIYKNVKKPVKPILHRQQHPDKITLSECCPFTTADILHLKLAPGTCRVPMPSSRMRWTRRWGLRPDSRCWLLHALLASCLLQPGAGMTYKFLKAAPHLQVAHPGLMGNAHTVSCHCDPRHRLMTKQEWSCGSEIAEWELPRHLVSECPETLQHCLTQKPEHNQCCSQQQYLCLRAQASNHCYREQLLTWRAFQTHQLLFYRQTSGGLWLVSRLQWLTDLPGMLI